MRSSKRKENFDTSIDASNKRKKRSMSYEGTIPTITINRKQFVKVTEVKENTAEDDEMEEEDDKIRLVLCYKGKYDLNMQKNDRLFGINLIEKRDDELPFRFGRLFITERLNINKNDHGTLFTEVQSISREQFEIRLDKQPQQKEEANNIVNNNKKYVIENFGTNGTFINEKKLSKKNESCELKDGDSIDFFPAKDNLLRKHGLCEFGFKFVVGRLDKERMVEILSNVENYNNEKGNGEGVMPQIKQTIKKERREENINKEFVFAVPHKREVIINDYPNQMIQPSIPSNSPNEDRNPIILNINTNINIQKRSASASASTPRSESAYKSNKSKSSTFNPIMLIASILSKIIAIYSIYRLYSDVLYPIIENLFPK